MSLITLIPKEGNVGYQWGQVYEVACKVMKNLLAIKEVSSPDLPSSVQIELRKSGEENLVYLRHLMMYLVSNEQLKDFENRVTSGKIDEDRLPDCTLSNGRVIFNA